MHTQLDRAQREIDALHDALEAWISGARPVDWEVELAGRLAPSFRNIMPNGEVLHREPMLRLLADAQGMNPAFRIQVRDVEIVAHAEGVLVATYVEWQRGARNAIRPENARRSTVVFEDDEGALRWRHLHEGWVPAAMMDAGDFAF